MDNFGLGWKLDSLDGLGAHDPNNVVPVIVNSMFFKHVPDAVYYLVC